MSVLVASRERDQTQVKERYAVVEPVSWDAPSGRCGVTAVHGLRVLELSTARVAGRISGGRRESCA